MKPEARLLYLVVCPPGVASAVLRGRGRVEAIFVARSFKELLDSVRRSRFAGELRLAWPPEAARALGLRAVEPEKYLGPCLEGVAELLRDFCRAALSDIGSVSGSAPLSGAKGEEDKSW